MDENTGDHAHAAVMSNGDVATTNGDIDVSDAKSKVVEYDCQSADITDDGGKVQKFSSKLKETKGMENGNDFHEKDYEETAQKSMQQKKGNTELGCSSSLQLAEKEKVSKMSNGGIKAEYTVGSDEQYKSQTNSVNKVGDANIETIRSSDSSYTKACSKIDEELPGDGGSGEAALAGRRVTEVSRGDFTHSEQISSNIQGPGGYSRSQGNLEEHSSNKHSHSTVTTPSGSSLHKSVSEKLTCKRESFKMESSSAAPGNQLEEASGAAAAAVAETTETTVTEPSKPGVINLTTKISSDDGDLLADAAASSFSKRNETTSVNSKFENISSTQKEGSSSAALYTRQHPDMTPTDNMSVSSVSSAHDANDVKMSSASSSESAYAAKMETNEIEKSKDFKYNRKSTDNLVKRILGESEGERKNKYKINMGGENEGEEEIDRDSLLQRRLASLDKSGRKSRGVDDFMYEEYEQEEMTYSKKSRGRVNRRGSGEQEAAPRGFRGGRFPSRASYDYDDDFEDQGYDRGYRGGRGRFARQQYIDDEDVFGPPMPPFQPLFRDEEFEPQKREETEDYVKEKTASIRGMVDRQTVVLENLRKASESFDELTDEIKNIRQAFIENQARRTMLFREDELPYEDEQGREQPRGRPKPKSRYVQEREADYEFAIKDAERRRKLQYSADDYGLEQDLPGPRGRQRPLALEGDKDDYGLAAYGKSKGFGRDFDDFGFKSYGAQDDYLSYGRSKGSDYSAKSQAGQALLKKSYYSQDDYSSTSYGAGSDAYNRRLRGLGGRSKSLYDEASGGEKDGFSLEDGAARRGRIGLQRTQYDPLGDDISSSKDRYGGVSAYGSGGSGYTRVGDPVASSASSAYGGVSARSSYTSSRLTSSAASSSSSSTAAVSGSTRPRISRSRTLSDIDFDRAGSADSGSSAQGGFQSRFLGKVRQKSLGGEDTSRSRDKPFKSRFLRSNFDLGDGSDSTNTYTSTCASSRLHSRTETKTETTEEKKE